MKLQYAPRLQYDAAATQEGGTTLPPPLSSLDSPAPSAPSSTPTSTPPATTPSASGIQPGDGTPKPVDLSQQQQQPPAAEPSGSAQEGLNEDGSLKEGYIRDAEGKVVKDPNYKAQEGDQEDREESASDEDSTFFEDVDKLHGEPLVVEYPEGTDPLSPEGVYHRDKALEKRAIARFEEYLKQRDPRSYAYMLHRQAGGSDEDFLADKTISLPAYETFKDNQDVQIQVLKSDLRAKGLDEEIVQTVVEKAIKDNTLFTKADTAYRERQAAHEKQLSDIEAAFQKAEKKYQESVAQIDRKLVESISDGKGMNFIIPDNDKKDFLAFVRSSLEYDTESGSFLIVQKAGEDLARQLESLYLFYKKGDLKALIQKEAQTQNRKRLGRTLERSKEGKPASQQAPQSTPAFVTLGSI